MNQKLTTREPTRSVSGYRPFSLRPGGGVFVRSAVSSIATFVVIFTGSLLGEQTQSNKREQVGEVLRQPVFRDQIRETTRDELWHDLNRLFVAPAIKKYLESHNAEISPTGDELAAAAAFFKRNRAEGITEDTKMLKERLSDIEGLQREPGDGFGGQLLTDFEKMQLRWQRADIKGKLNDLDTRITVADKLGAYQDAYEIKLRKHVYETFGGGRLLLKGGKYVPYDAERAWLEAMEKQGDFKITDSKLRTALYEPWTTADPLLLTTDKEAIREVCHPVWIGAPLPRASASTPIPDGADSGSVKRPSTNRTSEGRDMTPEKPSSPQGLRGSAWTVVDSDGTRHVFYFRENGRLSYLSPRWVGEGGEWIERDGSVTISIKSTRGGSATLVARFQEGELTGTGSEGAKMWTWHASRR